MKKIRLFITAALVIATVGSALAFKVFNPKNIYCDDSFGVCNALVNFTSGNTGVGATTNPCNESTSTKHYSTTQSTTNPCPANTATVYTPNQQ